MNVKWIGACALALWLPAAVGCSRDAKAHVDTSLSVATNDSVVAELPLPAMPDSLTDAAERADYLALHFWDAMDWANPKQALDTLFMEQNFANYLAVLPYATPGGVSKAAAHLMTTARHAGERQVNFLYGVVEKYLWQSDSPMRNEELFLPFVEWALADGFKPELAQARRDDIQKNRPGSEAADFSFETREGQRTTLHAQRGKPVMLMFYEPDCDQCLDEEQVMMAHSGLSRALEDGELRLVAVYIGDDRDGWQRHAATLPSTWTVGIDAAMEVDDRDLYSIGSTPSFYLIDEQGRVVVKDAQHFDMLFQPTPAPPPTTARVR